MRGEQLDRAADVIRQADALLITAGAGMGVDSGLPDFRGNEGFWKAYPPYARLGLSFVELANPDSFRRDPALGWGFYGHRLQLYRDTQPHPGFEILRRWCAVKPGGGFVFTSNVDGHFQRGGFPDDSILECHGSIHHLQCLVPCRQTVWPAEGTHITVDASTMRAREPLPRCPDCGALARPAILMFGDWNWVSNRTEDQENRLRLWLSQAVDRLAVVEIGAGRSVPTVRHFSERLAGQPSIRLIRINPREPEAPRLAVSLPMGGLAALQALDAIGV